MTTFSFGPTVNPGRFRKQKAAVKHRTAGIQAAYARRRESEAEAWRKGQFDRACIQAVIVGIKTALNFTVAECERPVWPDSPWYKPKTFKPEFFERAMRYLDPEVTEEFLHTQLHSFKDFWEIEHWLGARYTIIESMEFDGPWFRVPMRHDAKFPLWPEVYYYIDMSRVMIVDQKEGDTSYWRYWKLKPLPDSHVVTAELAEQIAAYTTSGKAARTSESLMAEHENSKSALDQAYEGLVFTGQDILGMMDKNQGYVHGEMWWNIPGKLIRKLFKRRTK